MPGVLYCVAILNTKLPPIERSEGAVVEAPLSIKKMVVEAFAAKVVVAGLENFTLFSVLVPTINPERYCVVVPLKVVVPSVDIILPVFAKFPPTKRFVEGKVVVPVSTAKLPVVVAGLSPKFQLPTVPLNSRL